MLMSSKAGTMIGQTEMQSRLQRLVCICRRRRCHLKGAVGNLHWRCEQDWLMLLIHITIAKHLTSPPRLVSPPGCHGPKGLYRRCDTMEPFDILSASCILLG